jgi:ribosomal protein L31
MRVKLPKRPVNVNPRLFQLTTIHSDGSSIRFQTTSPKPILYLTKDTLNNSLWVPSSTVIDDQLGELKKFNKRFGDLSEFQ